MPGMIQPFELREDSVERLSRGAEIHPAAGEDEAATQRGSGLCDGLDVRAPR